MLDHVWHLPSVRAGMQEQRATMMADVGRGEEIAGWKLGMGSEQAKGHYGISGPLVGYLLRRNCLPSGSVVDVQDWNRPLFEPELAVLIGEDVPATIEPQEAATLVTAVAPAIELVDVRQPDSDLSKVVGSNIFHQRVVLGPLSRLAAPSDLDDLQVVVRNGGRQIGATSSVTQNTGGVGELIAHAAAWLDAAGLRLASGHLVILGSVIPPVSVRPGDAIEYSCGPLGTVHVDFT